ncbi:hypothetical protein [Adhaeribacter soli]|uniref:DUF4252 domain-containing protein n=1 Tax=Adhaeribacter soli TaxID=2607655 RepID=A0A5N1J4X2_9BACT|nr:hypothetical protein [Adhaeribacter soli]KAA9340854.1 hypothetical protein F0P94_05340 [Adhaeribacter soli]
MKKTFTWAFSFLLVLLFIGTASAQNPLFGKKKPLPSTRGKASVKELGKELYTALQTGNTDRLTIYLPSDAELKDLKKNNATTDEMKDIVSSVGADQLESNLQQEIDALKGQMAADSFRVNNSTLVSVTGTRPNSKTPNITAVTVNLTDEKERPYTLTFEALKIDKRVFLFRQIQAKKEMQVANLLEEKP